jgi:hypothetical protein
MSQLALFEIDEPPATPGPVGRVYTTPLQALRGFAFIHKYLPACECEALGCAYPTLHDHGHHSGCRYCDCPASWLPEEAVEIEFPVEFSDGCGIWASLRSHFWHQQAEIDGEWRIVSSPAMQLYGACSETGYLSAQFQLNTTPADGWLVWGMLVAAEVHRDWCCPAKKRGKR